MKKSITQLKSLVTFLIVILFITNAKAQTDCHSIFGFHQPTNTLAINFSDSSTSPHTITSWLWEFGDGSISTSQNPSYTYPHDGTYFVCLTIHDDHGCSNQICHHITVTPIAQSGCHAAFGFHQSANSLEINFTDSSSSANTITSWAWDFGDGSTSTDENPHHIYTHDGTYYVCLTIHNDHGCSNQICHHITVTPIAQIGCHAAFGFHQSAGSLEINFADSSSSANTITSWAWDFGDGSTSTDENPHHTYTHDGTYNVCLTTHDDHGCSSTYCHHITVNHVADPCHALFTIHTDATGNILFTNTSTGTTAHTTYSWDFGDGSTSSDENPHHVYAHAGHYTVCLFITDLTTGCTSHYCHSVNYLHVNHHHHALVPQAIQPSQSGGNTQRNEEQYITNYPSPFATTSLVQYELAYDANVKIEIYDLLGSLISQLKNENELEGVHTQTISAENLNSGFYLLKITVGGETFNQKITVLK